MTVLIVLWNLKRQGPSKVAATASHNEKPLFVSDTSSQGVKKPKNLDKPTEDAINSKEHKVARASSPSPSSQKSKSLDDLPDPSQQPERAEAFHFHPTNHLELPPGLVSQKIVVRANGVRNCLIEILEGGHMAFCGEEIVPDALESRNIYIIVELGGDATNFAGLDFKNSCILNIWKDGSLEVDKEGIEASDSSGGFYVSQAVIQDGKRSVLMVRRREGLERQAELPVNPEQTSTGFETTNGNPAGERLQKSRKRTLSTKPPMNFLENVTMYTDEHGQPLFASGQVVKYNDIELRPGNGGRTLAANQAIYSINVTEFQYRIAPGSLGGTNVDLDVWGVVLPPGNIVIPPGVIAAITWSDTPLRRSR